MRKFSVYFFALFLFSVITLRFPSFVHAQKQAVPPGLLKKIEQTVKERQQQHVEEVRTQETSQQKAEESIQKEKAILEQFDKEHMSGESKVFYSGFDDQVKLWQRSDGQYLLTLQPTPGVFLSLLGIVFGIILVLKLFFKLRFSRRRSAFKVRRIEI